MLQPACGPPSKPREVFVKIKHHAAALFGNHAHGLVENLVAMAVGCKNVARRAACMDPNQHPHGSRRAARSRDLPARFAGPCVDRGTVLAKVAAGPARYGSSPPLLRSHRRSCGTRRGGVWMRVSPVRTIVTLVTQAIADQLGYSQDEQAVLFAERNQVWDARHLSVIAH